MGILAISLPFSMPFATFDTQKVRIYERFTSVVFYARSYGIIVRFRDDRVAPHPLFNPRQVTKVAGKIGKIRCGI
ncbi:MAG: hypothetical protein L6Q71_02240 [Planctomycetes bacterium]|nr:hypothetical protein [Planctomycetota bacterium]